MNSLTGRRDLLDVIAGPDAEIDLAGAALLIARDEYPGLDVDAYGARLDRMAAEVRPAIAGAGGNPFAAIDALNGFLFRDLGYRGNREDYFDPRNSYLNEVMDRRRGIPITLSVVYMEVAARAGFPVEGVGFPGHFLVRRAAAGRRILIDPFCAGEILLEEDCRVRLMQACGEDLPLEPRFFEAADNRAILVRMLANLKRVYLQRGDPSRALRVIDRLVTMAPHDPRHLLDRGLALAGLGRYARAIEDLERYVALSGGAAGAADIRAHLKSLRRRAATLN